VTQPTPPVIQTRDQAVAFLDARIGSGVRPGLERISGLLEYMGNPQTSFPSIHIAGTNGKTTTARMAQQILGSLGLSTGGFTSPHLHTVEERFSLAGRVIDGDTFASTVSDMAWFVVAYEAEHDTTVTYFEVTAALAFLLFANAVVDVGVTEVGLGGRLDATNVLEADVSVITGIDIDHVEFLGTTIAAIAGEKAAIVKQGGTLVTGQLPDEASEVVAKRVSETEANWIVAGSDYQVTAAEVAVGGWQCSISGVFGEYEELYLPIHGRHQVDNLATAIASCEMFLGRGLDESSLPMAVGSITAPGRLEVVRRHPLVIIDGAHNAQGFAGLAATLDEEFPALPWKLVLGLRGERSAAALVGPLSGAVTQVYAAAAGDPAAVDPLTVAQDAAATLGVPAHAFESPELALAEAVADAGPEGGVVVAGSLYLAGDLREAFSVRADHSAEAHVRYEAEVPDNPEDEDDDASWEESEIF
jgi:dihydrofolate synthase/folylpolyglutamate synthase